MFAYIKLMRVKHWIKNAFVLAPMLFSLKFLEISSLIIAMKAFISFSLVASFVYIINDILDVEKDRKHPKKKKRPIASGKISPLSAFIFSIIVFVLGFGIAYDINIQTFVVIFIYFVMNLLYSLKLKHIVLLDVFIIAIGFLLRVYAGAFAIAVPVSHWIILTTFFISLFLGFGKRRNELLVVGEANKTSHRPVLAFYNEKIVDAFIVISLTLTVMTYTLYTIDSNAIKNIGSDNLIYTVPVVVYGMFRYLFLIYGEDKGGDPAELVLKDKWIMFTCFIWLIMAILVMYFKNFGAILV